MILYVCIDDTDSPDSRGTGELAFLLTEEVEKRGWGTCGPITRHQLLVHPDIPYTSHNSSMCFGADMECRNIAMFTEFAGDFLARESADGSDPGLCVAVSERLEHPDLLVEFGYRTKRSVVKMSDAYSVAEKEGLHLSSHGGSGQGIIGALAGVGLRISGNDGRMRGSLEIPAINGMATIGDILMHPWVDAVQTPDGVSPKKEGRVRLVDKIKTVLLGGRHVLLVLPEEEWGGEAEWRTCTRRQLKEY
jgi:hypothetical protein